TTEVFIAQLRDDVICTVTLVIDGELGLPMQSLYAQTINERRSMDLRLAEVSCLADRRNDPRRFFPLFVALSRLMVQSARLRGVDQLLVTVHPRHARFYHRYMAFETIGEEKAYPMVKNNPALPLCLDFARVDRDHPASYDQFFGERLPASATEYRPMSDNDRRYFQTISADLAANEPRTKPGLPIEAVPSLVTPANAPMRE